MSNLRLPSIPATRLGIQSGNQPSMLLTHSDLMGEASMQCPKCNSSFETVTYENIEVDRCTSCKGIWFDMLEKEDLNQIEGSVSIDIGDENVGEEYNQMREINCPKCDVKMLPMVDKDQFHIKYESCPACFGTFFDAGEFKDYNEQTVVERFKQMVHTLRTNL